jgi:hypothetical protein
LAAAADEPALIGSSSIRRMAAHCLGGLTSSPVTLSHSSTLPSVVPTSFELELDELVPAPKISAAPWTLPCVPVFIVKAPIRMARM